MNNYFEKLYKFEVMIVLYQASEGNKERAKGIFYKALQNVPWAKVYLD